MGLFREFLKNPLRTGAVAQSSRFLIQKMLAPIDFATAKTLIELGPGEGAITKALLSRMRSDSTLTCLELNPTLAKKLEELQDNRLRVINTNAKNLHATGYAQADYIISGLPLAVLPADEAKTVIEHVKDTLNDQGAYIQFQYSFHSLRLLKEHFTVRLSFTLLNIPPALIYTCTKKQ